jgi:hypothetical protein
MISLLSTGESEKGDSKAIDARRFRAITGLLFHACFAETYAISPAS